MERAILRNRDFTLIAGRTDRTETARDPDHLLAILDAHFGLPFRASRNGLLTFSRAAPRAEVEAAREGRIGGVVLFQGDSFGIAAIASRLQGPLPRASDYEWGPRCVQRIVTCRGSRAALAWIPIGPVALTAFDQ